MRSRCRSRWVGPTSGDPGSNGGGRRARTLLTTAVVTVMTLAGMVGCGDKDPTPEQVRDEAREQLVEDGATAAQARCITDRISDDLLETLSTEGKVDRESKDFEAYSDAVIACSATK